MSAREVILSPYDVAQTYIGIEEKEGKEQSYDIMAWLTRFNSWPNRDEIPWCSAFVTEVAIRCRCNFSTSLKARSWLGVGEVIEYPLLGDVVILRRGEGGGPEDMDSPGHVGFFAGFSQTEPGSNRGYIHILGGNQNNGVNVRPYPKSDVLGYRNITITRAMRQFGGHGIGSTMA